MSLPASVAVPVVLSGCDTFCSTCSSGGHLAVGAAPEESDFHKNDGWHLSCKGSDECEYSHGPQCEYFASGAFEGLLESLRNGEVMPLASAPSSRGTAIKSF